MKRAKQTRTLLWSGLFLLAGCGETVPASDVPLNAPQTALAQTNSSMDRSGNTHFVTKLGLIQGHLWVASQLVEADLFELGAKHAKHPAQEVYQELLPFFDAVSSPGFAEELEAMSGQFTSSSKTDFRQSYQQVMNAVDDIVARVELTDSDRLRVANSLIEQALIEYRAGVSDGEIADLQEYQDARGFIEIAARFISKIQNDPQRSALLANIQTAKKLWPDLDPKETISGEESALEAVLADLQAIEGAAP
ncbi:MAG: hypothetical protein ISP99_07630 [Pseudomonadales bacterium]|nr:hypothetical protein [Pseudomonadales bacterium]MBL6815141.1 hypothetical protein [Pseudomonadales bacterium]